MNVWTIEHTHDYTTCGECDEWSYMHASIHMKWNPVEPLWTAWSECIHCRNELQWTAMGLYGIAFNNMCINWMAWMWMNGWVVDMVVGCVVECLLRWNDELWVNANICWYQFINVYSGHIDDWLDALLHHCTAFWMNELCDDWTSVM